MCLLYSVFSPYCACWPNALLQATVCFLAQWQRSVSVIFSPGCLFFFSFFFLKSKQRYGEWLLKPEHLTAVNSNCGVQLKHSQQQKPTRTQDSWSVASFRPQEGALNSSRPRTHDCVVSYFPKGSSLHSILHLCRISSPLTPFEHNASIWKAHCATSVCASCSAPTLWAEHSVKRPLGKWLVLMFGEPPRRAAKSTLARTHTCMHKYRHP